MCGLSGIYRWDGVPADEGLLKKMTDRLVHRGPDDSGYYFSASRGENAGAHAGLGFRRLSIIDLSAGHQPMGTEDGKIQIVFNGEIYNFLELRKDLEARGCKFLTRSDTEVILHLYRLYGPDCVRHLRGMFAFAVWDAAHQSLFLARDRIGKKPLFYAQAGNALYFASEMKALLEVPEIRRDVRTEALPLYLAYQFIPGDMTIFKGVRRLPPAHTLTCNPKGDIKIERYWTLSRKPQTGRSVEELCDELRRQLREATRIRLMADVPLGAFLSGGIDSSAVVGMMAQEMKEPVKTFSIGFEESDFSELEYARVIAKKFKTDHHEFTVRPDAVAILPKLAWHYDQPFADPSALPSYYVANETRKHVTVALNGDGGDESFGGYLRYRADLIFNAFAAVPRPLRALLGSAIEKTLPGARGGHLLKRILKAAGVMGATPHEFNFKIFAYFDQPALRRLFSPQVLEALQNRDVYDYFRGLYGQSDSREFLDQILACDAAGYLPDCLLVKMDIASMSNSLEARSPFLDHKLMEFAASIPAKYKVKFSGGKWILKKALEGFIPDEILYRRKMGFGVPLSKWFRGPLKGYLRETLLGGAARKRGYFNMEEVERLVTEHQASVKDHGYKLWALMMLELWHQVYVDKSHGF